MAPPLIELEHISKVYQAGEIAVPALTDVNFSIERGEFVCIVGQSGSGKTTLLDILGCLNRPSSGDYRLDGERITSLSDHALTIIRNQKIGFIFQTFHLLPRKTALENVQLPLLYAGHSREAQRQRALDLLTRVGLENRTHHFTNQLSGGQQQRVAIARALANRPAIVLADEPTGNLDSQSGQDILSMFHDLHQQGQTIIMITHDRDIAAQAERRISLTDGKVSSDERLRAANQVMA
ncbi:MAG: ABC transporter ATP-binding protein [Nitrospirales bacterium]|nr:ABC transporter ATP-binding protein [Nitrospira sp.]MDR4501648.1 ABC transporter ATP-binding protein [Nitrospirales bacterium]